ncbi:MAG: biopolymer transporter ExbD [Pseudomonadota bacterium]
MARRSFVRPESDEDDVNVTPLLDIVFIMLIFFIVTSTFVKEPGIEVDRPEAVTAEEQKFAKIIVAISNDDEIWINKEEVELGAVRVTVEALRRENPKATAVIQADTESTSRFLVEVSNQIRDAGVSQIAVSTTQTS